MNEIVSQFRKNRNIKTHDITRTSCRYWEGAAERTVPAPRQTVNVHSRSYTALERSTGLRLRGVPAPDLQLQQPLPRGWEALGVACLDLSLQSSDGGGSGCCSNSTSSNFYKTEEFQKSC